MTRQARQTLMLFAVVAALGLAAIGVSLRDRRSAPRPLLANPTAQVDAIELRCASCDGVRRFRRVQDRWRMVAPWDVPADVASVERLLAVPATPVRRRFGEAPADAAALGLSPPFAELLLGTARIAFGTTEAVDQMRYVRVGDAVSLVPDRISVVLLAPAERFVDRDPFADLGGGLAAVEEAGTPWPAARFAALATWRAEAVEALPADAPRTGRALVLRDAGGRPHGYLLASREGHFVLLRDDRPLAWRMPAGTALPD